MTPWQERTYRPESQYHTYKPRRHGDTKSELFRFEVEDQNDVGTRLELS
jgi:hypothetical protein